MLKNWNASRILRLALGVIFLTAGIVEHEPIAWLAGIILGTQAVLNVCCAGPSCAVPATNRTNGKGVSEVSYDEVQ